MIKQSNTKQYLQVEMSWIDQKSVPIVVMTHLTTCLKYELPYGKLKSTSFLI